MKQSFKFARSLGIDGLLHVSFLLVLAFILSAHGPSPRVFAGLGFVLALVGAVLVHRFAQQMMARQVAVAPVPVGPVACPARIPEKPAQELRMSCLALSGGEVPSAAAKSSTGDIAVREVMLTDFQTLSPDDTLGEATHLLMGGSQEDFPVVDYSCLVGVLTRDRLFEALRSEGESALVRDTMERDFETAQPSDRLDEVLVRTESSPAALPVTSGGRLIGMLTEQNISERLMIRAALTSRRHTSSFPDGSSQF